MRILQIQWNVLTQLSRLRVEIDPKMSSTITESDGGAC
jgi:hypothetical protein